MLCKVGKIFCLEIIVTHTASTPHHVGPLTLSHLMTLPQLLASCAFTNCEMQNGNESKLLAWDFSIAAFEATPPTGGTVCTLCGIMISKRCNSAEISKHWRSNGHRRNFDDFMAGSNTISMSVHHSESDILSNNNMLEQVRILHTETMKIFIHIYS